MKESVRIEGLNGEINFIKPSQVDEGERLVKAYPQRGTMPGFPLDPGKGRGGRGRPRFTNNPQTLEHNRGIYETPF
jgi:hypothetical protein